MPDSQRSRSAALRWLKAGMPTPRPFSQPDSRVFDVRAWASAHAKLESALSKAAALSKSSPVDPPPTAQTTDSTVESPATTEKTENQDAPATSAV